ncbi:hypothetical protein ACFZDK_33760 [Streptomyces sp. NPDC007901]|uniref:hypothetical protein n=1 Tax=Streptomyces sp. NPDC007901 TaxID=3364785 RepID=UPI0036ECDE16
MRRRTYRRRESPGADGRRAPHEHEIVDRRWAADLRGTLLCVGSFLSLLVLIDEAAGTLTPARAALWSGLALLLLLVLMPPRVSVCEGRLTVRTLGGTRWVCTDRLVAAHTTGHEGQRLVLRDALGGRVEFDSQVLAANPALWHRLDTDARVSAREEHSAAHLAALRALAERIDRETARAVFQVSGMAPGTDEPAAP